MPRKLLLFLSLLAMAGCKPYAFLPDLQLTPQLKQAGEMQMEVNSGIGSNVGIAYSPVDHLGIKAHGYLMGGDSAENNTNYRKRMGGSLSAGGYYLFENALLFESYAGAEVGSNKAFGRETLFDIYDNTQMTYKINNRYLSIFLNPTISVVHDHIMGGINMRISRTTFYQENSLFTELSMNRQDTIFYKSYHPDYPKNFYLATPAIFLKLGTRNIKGTIQAGLPLMINKQDFGNIKKKLFYPFVFNFGIEARLFND